MTFYFIRFFISYIFKAKTRQRLFLMAMVGLFLSCISLVIVQATLRGLQDNRIDRAKSIMGHYVVSDFDDVKELESFLNDNSILYNKEFFIEGLVRFHGRLAPVIIHGITSTDFLPEFLGKKVYRDQIYASDYISMKLKSTLSDELTILSPLYTDPFFGDIPRQKSLSHNRFVETLEPDIDEYHVWTDIRNIHYLTTERSYNTVRIYEDISENYLAELTKLFPSSKFTSWESENKNLLYALSLENSIMIFLFMATVFLVVISIAGGLAIFYNRLKVDFASFWIQGLSVQKIKMMGMKSIGLITLITLILGNIGGLIFVKLLKEYSPQVMPQMFVDRSLPVKLEPEIFLYSFLIPAVITFIVSYLSSKNYFSKKADFINLIRSASR